MSGENRYATAAVLGTFFEPGGTVFVASGAGFPDALAGGPAAAREGGPILLLAPSSIPAETRDLLDELTPSRIVVLGGPAAVSQSLMAQLEQWAPVVRVAGPDRYSTAALLARRGFPDGARGVLVATGRQFPDALSGASRGSAQLDPLPILLVDPDRVPDATYDEIRRLDPDFIAVLGGPSVVDDRVVDRLRSLAPAVERVAGQNRYETSADVAGMYDSAATRILFLATGANFPDALAAAPVVGYLNGPTLLVPPTGELPAPTASALQRFTGLEYVIGIGGAAALDEGVLEQVAALINGADGGAG